MGISDLQEIRERLRELKNKVDPAEIFDEEATALSCCRPNSRYRRK